MEVASNTEHRKIATLLALLGVFPELLLGSLGSAFIDNVLIGKDYGRAIPIISVCFALTVITFALKYSSAHYTTDDSSWIKIFSMALNGLLIFLIQYQVMLICAVMLAVFRLFVKTRTRETVQTVRTVLDVAVLFACGLFVMRGEMSMGALYAVSLFSSRFFTLGIVRRETTETHKANPHKTWKNIRTGAVGFVIFTSLAGMLAEGIFITLQRSVLRDCLPAGDWVNLMRNAAFMCGITVCSHIVRKSNNIGVARLLSGTPLDGKNPEMVSGLLLNIVFGVFYALQLWQYSDYLAPRAVLFGGAVYLIYNVFAKVAGQGGKWLIDEFFAFALGCMTIYIYTALAVRAFEIPIGDFFIFMAAFRYFFSGIKSTNKLVFLLKKV